MTDSNKAKKISEILWSNAQINSVELNQRDFTPTNRGHGAFVKTLGNDIVYDLRLAKEKPFLGHTHPIQTHHNFKNLNNPLEIHHYSVPKNEFVMIVETFQKVHFSEVLDPNFKITYHNLVITIDEDVLNVDISKLENKIQDLVNENPDNFFWIVERDISLLAKDDLFVFRNLMKTDQVHLCLDYHFVSSIFLYSHHIFSEDDNVQLFLSIKKYFNEVIGEQSNGKNKRDSMIIDDYLTKHKELPLLRKSRYLISQKPLNQHKLNENGIIFTNSSDTAKTILALPYAGTKEEIIDILNRIHKSL